MSAQQHHEGRLLTHLHAVPPSCTKEALSDIGSDQHADPILAQRKIDAG